jgi:hypothetical protein
MSSSEEASSTGDAMVIAMQPLRSAARRRKCMVGWLVVDEVSTGNGASKMHSYALQV